MEAINVDQLSDHVLKQLNDEMCSELSGECVFINCVMRAPLDDEFRVVLEELTGGKKGSHLIVMLETVGGFMETVERLVSVMRNNYKKVSFVIPNYAYSAGTVLALSGDSIYMDYYSVLGPIDPQYPDGEGKLLPGYGYLAKFKELTQIINSSDPSAPNSCKAELAYLVKKFDPALLFHIEQGIDHGLSLIAEWLPKYKFKDWKITGTNKEKVTPTMKKARAENIAKTLGDAEKWHSHGRGISMSELSGKEIKLQIDDFGKNKDLSHKIKNYHGLAVDYYTNKQRISGYIHSRLGLRRVL